MGYCILCEENNKKLKLAEDKLAALTNLCNEVISESKYCEAYDIGVIRYNDARFSLIEKLKQIEEMK